MSHVLRVCLFFLTVYSVEARMRANDMSLETNYNTSTETSFIHNSTEKMNPSRHSRTYRNRHWFPYQRLHPLEDVKTTPRTDPWPDRPHKLDGAAEEFPLSKCCNNGQMLNPAMDGCEKEFEGSSPRPWLQQPLNNESVRFPPCAAAEVLRLGAIEASSRLSITPYGALLFQANDVHNNGTRAVLLERDLACADIVSGDNGPFAVLLCPCNGTACLRKCCSKEQMLVVQETSVATVTPECKAVKLNLVRSWRPHIDTSPESLNVTTKEGYTLLPAKMPADCKWGLSRAPPSWAQPQPGLDFKIFAGGLASIRTIPAKETNNFCVDGEYIADGSLVPSIVFCADRVLVPVVDRWMAALGVAGALALVAAIAVLALLPELRATPFGRALMSYSAALLALAVIGISWTLAPDVGRARCIFNVTWSQYFLQAAAFWLNVMCYDIGIAFRSYQVVLDKQGRAARRRFTRYWLYAWGCPLVTTAPLIALQSTHTAGSPWRPIEWFMQCHYSNSLAQLIFQYLPIMLLLILNCVIFVWTAYRIRVLQKDADILMDSDSNEESLYPARKKLLLFLKLIWLMGVAETLLELIAFSVSTSSHWYTSNAVDFSRALCIFGLTCCKNKVLQRLRKRLGERTCCVGLRRGSRVGPDSDAAAATDTDTTAISTAFSAQVPTSETTDDQDTIWNANVFQATTSAAITATQDDISNTPEKQDGYVKQTPSQNGIFQSAAYPRVIEKEGGIDSKPPPSSIEMKVLSTTSL